MAMETREYTVSFLTPAFLGDAAQEGCWRTPPFKALLRQWWRVAAAAGYGYDHHALREVEGRLFGHAWLKGDRDAKGRPAPARQSRVRIRLANWTKGSATGAWGSDPRVLHPEVGKAGMKVGAHLYLGYGPLAYAKDKGTSLKANCAVQADESRVLRLAWPEGEGSPDTILRLAHWFGSIGGRSRNGWGSMALADGSGDLAASALPDPVSLRPLCRPMEHCLQLDWPHAFGTDDADRILIWRTREAHTSWREVMRDLAEIKIGFRTRLSLHHGAKGNLEDRHVLAYPVTNHNVIGNKARLANQLRFKVISPEPGKLLGLAYHLPCAMPAAFMEEARHNHPPDRSRQIQVWRTVHAELDRRMERIG